MCFIRPSSADMAETTEAQLAARKRLSDNLKRLRKDAGMSQEDLGDRAGLHRTYVSQVERMLVNVSLDNLVLFAGALGVDLVEILVEQHGTSGPLK